MFVFFSGCCSEWDICFAILFKCIVFKIFKVVSEIFRLFLPSVLRLVLVFFVISQVIQMSLKTENRNPSNRVTKKRGGFDDDLPNVWTNVVISLSNRVRRWIVWRAWCFGWILLRSNFYRVSKKLLRVLLFWRSSLWVLISCRLTRGFLIST